MVLIIFNLRNINEEEKKSLESALFVKCKQKIVNLQLLVQNMWDIIYQTLSKYM